MITRAIIIDKDLNIGKLKVRIPILDGIGDGGISTNWASIIYTPGLDIDYQIGDIVIVGFEDNDIGSPIVLGFLKLKNTKIDSRIYETVKELKVEDNFLAPLNTTIGKTSYQKLFSSIETTLTINDKESVLHLTKLTISGDYKTSYIVGEVFDKTGLIATATYNNGTTEDVTSKIIINNINPLTVNDKEITFTFSNEYGKVSNTIQIIVTEESSGT